MSQPALDSPVITPPPAPRLQTDAEAVAAARDLAERFAAGAADRDRDRRLPADELDDLSRSGLLAITVPRQHGGADVATETLGTVIRLLAAADGSLGQIPQNHFFFVEVLRQNGTPQQQARFYGEVLDGRRFGNALAEPGARHALELRTTIRHDGDGYRVNGTKYYSTGALFAHWIPVYALDEERRVHAAYVPAGAPGLEIVDDWDGIGQRTTASGTVRLDDVHVPADHVVPHYRTFQRAEAFGAYGQFIHAAIDAGIAEGALAAARDFVRHDARPWAESGVERAAEDPLIVQEFGELALRVRAARALLGDAARALDEARAALAADAPGAQALASEASVAVAAARAASSAAAVSVGSDILALGGARAASASRGLDRYWRDARTHTLHDPRRWKIQHLGNYELNGVEPPRNGIV
jgi:SfnB family sulfur acquisition oxidoreductase